MAKQIASAAAHATSPTLISAFALAGMLVLGGCSFGFSQADPMPGEPCGPAASGSDGGMGDPSDELSDGVTGDPSGEESEGAAGDPSDITTEGDGDDPSGVPSEAAQGDSSQGATEGADGGTASGEDTAPEDPLDNAATVDDDGLPGFPYALAIDPDLPSRAWFTADRGLLFSDDGGFTWESMQNSKINSGRMIVALRPQGGNLLVAGPGVLRSSADDGVSWVDLPGPPTSDQGDGAGASGDPGDSAGERESEGSGDGEGAGEGADADAGEGMSSTEAIVGPDIRGLTVDPADPTTLHALMGDGTVQRSADAGATWRVVGERAPAAAYGLWPVAASPTILWTVSLDDRSICRSDDGGEHWEHVEPEGLTGQLQGVALASDGIAYAATIAGLFRSEDGGSSWEARGPFRAVISAATQPEDSDKVLVIVFGGNIFRSEDGGLTWGDDDAAGAGGDGSGDGDEEGSGAEPTAEGDG